MKIEITRKRFFDEAINLPLTGVGWVPATKESYSVYGWQYIILEKNDKVTYWKEVRS